MHQHCACTQCKFVHEPMMIPEDNVAQSFKTLEHFRRSLVLMFNKSLWHCPSHEQVPWYALGQVELLRPNT